MNELAVANKLLTIDPTMTHIPATAGINQERGGIGRSGIASDARVQGDKVGGLSGFEAANLLLEAERRKCDFLEEWAPPNARVVWGRAEEQETDWAGVALAKALAPPPVAAEWCLPLVRSGGNMRAATRSTDATAGTSCEWNAPR